MSRRDRLSRYLLNGQFPTDARISDVRALDEEAGWTHDRIHGSHYQVVRPNQRTEVVAVHSEMVRVDVLKKRAKAMTEAREQ